MVFVLVLELFIQCGKIEVQLSQIGGLELAPFQFDGDQTAQPAMIEEQINEKFLLRNEDTYGADSR